MEKRIKAKVRMAKAPTMAPMAAQAVPPVMNPRSARPVRKTPDPIEM
jgi:hypothetical protein